MRLYFLDLLTIKRFWDRFKRRRAKKETIKRSDPLDRLAELYREADKIEESLGDRDGYINK